MKYEICSVPTVKGRIDSDWIEWERKGMLVLFGTYRKGKNEQDGSIKRKLIRVLIGREIWISGDRVEKCEEEIKHKIQSTYRKGKSEWIKKDKRNDSSTYRNDSSTYREGKKSL